MSGKKTYSKKEECSEYGTPNAMQFGVESFCGSAIRSKTCELVISLVKDDENVHIPAGESCLLPSRSRT